MLKVSWEVLTCGGRHNIWVRIKWEIWTCSGRWLLLESWWLVLSFFSHSDGVDDCGASGPLARIFGDSLLAVGAARSRRGVSTREVVAGHGGSGVLMCICVPILCGRRVRLLSGRWHWACVPWMLAAGRSAVGFDQLDRMEEVRMVIVKEFGVIRLS